jgi:hypothetical protein
MWENSGLSELSGSVSSTGTARGGSVRMFGVAASGGRTERRATWRLSTWTRDYLRRVALADLGCAVVGVFMAAQVRFGSNVTSMYLALSLTLPVLWIAALWLAGAYDARFIGAGSDEYRKILNAGVSLTAAVAIFSYASNLELSLVYMVIALPGMTLLDMATRLALRKRPHRRRTAGKRTHTVGAGVVRPGECDEVVGVPVSGGIKAPAPCLGTLEDRPRPASRPRSRAYRVLASRSL